MALEIQWSPKSLQKFHDVVSYLDKNWGNQVAKDFVRRTEILIQTLTVQPKIFRTISNTLEIREAIVTKHNFIRSKIINSSS